MRNEKINNYQFDFDRKILPSGLYFFKIMENDKVMAQGKLMMQLHLTMNIVKQYCHSLYQKLAVSNRTEAVNKFFKT